MKVLITSSRMPFALDEVRKFGSSGHEVYAADTFGSAPGNHSKYVTEYFVLDSPRDETSVYVEQLRDIVVTRRIELVVPAFEEAFYIAKHREAFRGIATLFIPPFEVLALLHDKARFTRFAEELGVAVPATTVATNAKELEDASTEYPEYFARPAFSRGGVRVLTNTGPLAGMLSFADADPSPKNPWIVQEFVRGRDVCSFSVVRSGRVVAHAVYVHPKTIEHAAGIVFESIDEPRTLDIVRTIAEATGYDGQLSFDYRQRANGDILVLESNPRPTSGVALMPNDMFVEAVLGPADRPVAIAPAGTRRHLTAALVRDMMMNWREIPADLVELFSSTPDLYWLDEDWLPGLFQWFSYHFVRKGKWSDPAAMKRSGLVAGYFRDVIWNGEAID